MFEIQAIKKKLPPQRISVPGSKSYSNRALLLAALAKGKSSLKGLLECEDTAVMIQALKLLGVKIKKRGNIYHIEGTGGRLKKPAKTITLKNAGTAVRSLTATLSTQPFKSTITGNKRMRERPIQDLIDALEPLTKKIKTSTGYPPIKITGPLQGGTTSIKGSQSSQYLSSLLMAAPYAQDTITIKIQGALTSLPYREMTLSIMEAFGVKVTKKNHKSFTIQPQQYKGTQYSIEGDASSATYPLALAALHGSIMSIDNIPSKSKQADMLFLKILKKMGCQVQTTKTSIRVKGPKKLKALGTINLNKLPDAAMTVAMLCAFTKGRSKLTGIGNLRIKETDRLHALLNELTKIGGDITEGKDFLTIHGNPENLHGAIIETYNDHRMAMCFAIAGSTIPNIRIQNPKCVQKTYPTFWKELKQWGISSKLVTKKQNPNLILSGLRGTGKTSIGKELAKQLSYTFIDTDILITERFGPIPTIVKEYGWEYFRKLEAEIAKELSSTNATVISTGGGMLIHPHNIKNLKKSGYIVLLKAEPSILTQRIAHDKNRPRLTNKKNLLQEFKQLWNDRRESYLHACDFALEVSFQSTFLQRDIKKKAAKIILDFKKLAI